MVDNWRYDRRMAESESAVPLVRPRQRAEPPPFSWAGWWRAARIPFVIIGMSVAGVGVAWWGAGFTSYLQMQATVACVPDIASVPWPAALAGYLDGAVTLLSLGLCCGWAGQRWKAGTDGLWIFLTLVGLLLVIAFCFVLAGAVGGLDPSGYIPMCGEGP